MAAEVMAALAPEARFAGVARLSGFRLELRRRSIRWQGGAADIVSRPDEEVWGVAYELPPEALAPLDGKEAAGSAYRRRRIEIELDGRRLPALAYEVIDKEAAARAPTPEYAALLLRASRERGLPPASLRVLEGRLTSFG